MVGFSPLSAPRPNEPEQDDLQDLYRLSSTPDHPFHDLADQKLRQLVSKYSPIVDGRIQRHNQVAPPDFALGDDDRESMLEDAIRRDLSFDRLSQTQPSHSFMLNHAHLPNRDSRMDWNDALNVLDYAPTIAAAPLVAGDVYDLGHSMMNSFRAGNLGEGAVNAGFAGAQGSSILKSLAKFIR